MLTGETQLRARRTRIKILKAIADKNGVAGFSDIKLSTGLSTGSIYYHLERMGNYVTKNSKYYMITEEGLQHLREVDPKYAEITPLKRTEEQVQPEGSGASEETIRRPRYLGVRHYAFIGVVLTAIAFAAGRSAYRLAGFLFKCRRHCFDSKCSYNCSIIFDDKVLLSCNQIQGHDALSFGTYSPACWTVRIFRRPIHWRSAWSDI